VPHILIGADSSLAPRTLCVALVTVLSSPVGYAIGETITTTTTYSYNADGALTQVVEQVDGQPATTTYLTWDNCVPSTTDPTSCAQITTGNGNLAAVGPIPGTANAERSFHFDSADRLSGYIDADDSVSYRFHPTWLMASSTLDSGDTRYFYYDNAGTAQMTNIEDSGSGLISVELGALRSLSDGGLQVLLSPRKDVAGVFDPALGTFSPYRYDPFGDDGDQGTGPSDYDLNDNPHRYAGEYKDPTWGGYYLRARWYDPAHHSFISRDPMANLNRYGYTAGNPVNRIDPSGKKYRSYKKFMRPLGKFLEKYTSPAATDNIPVVRIFLGTVVTPLDLIADPAGFYHQQIASDHGLRLAVALGTVALDYYSDGLLAEDRSLEAKALHVTERATVGVLNAEAAATSHNFRRFDKQVFFQGLEYTAGSIAQTQLAAMKGLATVGQLQDKLLPWDGHPNFGDFARTFRVALAYKKKTSRTGSSGQTNDRLAELSRYDQTLADRASHQAQIGISVDSAFGRDAPKAATSASAGRGAGTDREGKRGDSRRVGLRPGIAPLLPSSNRLGQYKQKWGPVAGPPPAHFPQLNSAIHTDSIIKAAAEPY
jgi:RHS repeat-associated protein